jgi:glycosyltransferase involved in cell wall biosynthesis
MGNVNRILLAQRACIEKYPPTLNQAALLSQIADVTVLDAITASEADCVLTPPDVERVRILQKLAIARVRNVLARLAWLSGFYRAFNHQLDKKPAVTVAYDPEAIFWLLQRKRSRHTMRVAHLHEMPMSEYVESSIVGRFALRRSLKNLHRADLVVMPDLHRAQWMQQQCGLDELPMVVMNCPRRLEKLPESRLLPFLHERGINTTRIVHYQGAVGVHHFLEAVIASMQFWRLDSIFVIIGAVGDRYRYELETLAEARGVKGRLLFTGRVPYSEVFSWGVGASVGVSFLDGQYLQFKYSAGASNKRFEYVALGIPQVTNPLPGVQELFVQPGVATPVPCDDIEAIGKAINAYLENEDLCSDVFHKARALHLNEYNYERQMQPLLNAITTRQEKGLLL